MGHQNVHGAQHVDGSDNIPLATASTPGLMSAQQFLDLSDSVANTWLRPILSTLDIPPVTPLVGDRYRIVPTAVGAWTLKEDQIVEWTGAWTFTEPTEGMMVYDLNLDRVFRYEAGAWAQWPAAADVDEAGATMNTDTSLAGNAYFLDDDTMAADDDTKVASQQSIKAYVTASIAAAVAGLLDYKGGYEPATDTLEPPTGGTVFKGDMWTILSDGLFFTEQVRAGDVIIAEKDDPTLVTDYTIVERNLDIASESVAGIVKVAVRAGTGGLVDGDKIDINWTPTYYTPDATPAQADDTDDLTAHLQGIDTAVGANASGISNHVSDTGNPHATDMGNLGAGTLTELNTVLVASLIATYGGVRDIGIGPTAQKPITGTTEQFYYDTDEKRLYRGTGAGWEAVAPGLHNTTHQHGGSDEIATATPAANVIPKADGSGKLDSFVSDATEVIKGKVELAANGESGAGLAVQGNDSRLSDARTPLAHDFAGAEHNPSLLSAVNSKITDATLIDTGDPRLSDARTPTAHNLAGPEHNADTLSNLNAKITDATLIDTNDARLSDSRDPNAHALVSTLHTVPAPFTVTPDGTPGTTNIDWATNGPIQLVDLVNAIGTELITFSGMQQGHTYRLFTKQHPATPQNITLNDANVLVAGGTNPTTFTLSVGAAAIDEIILFYDGTNVYVEDFRQNYG